MPPLAPTDRAAATVASEEEGTRVAARATLSPRSALFRMRSTDPPPHATTAIYRHSRPSWTIARSSRRCARLAPVHASHTGPSHRSHSLCTALTLAEATTRHAIEGSPALHTLCSPTDSALDSLQKLTTQQSTRGSAGCATQDLRSLCCGADSTACCVDAIQEQLAAFCFCEHDATSCRGTIHAATPIASPSARCTGLCCCCSEGHPVHT